MEKRLTASQVSGKLAKQYVGAHNSKAERLDTEETLHHIPHLPANVGLFFITYLLMFCQVLFYNNPSNRASTTSLGWLFHSLMHLTVRILFLILSLNFTNVAVNKDQSR